MVEFRPAGLGVWFWVGFGVFVPFSTICLFFPSFTMTWAPCPHGVRTRGKKKLSFLLAHCIASGEKKLALRRDPQFRSDQQFAAVGGSHRRWSIGC